MSSMLKSFPASQATAALHVIVYNQQSALPYLMCRIPPSVRCMNPRMTLADIQRWKWVCSMCVSYALLSAFFAIFARD